MIITNERCSIKGPSSEGKKFIIMEQLKQIGLKEGSDFIAYTKEKDENENTVLISIKIPMEMLNQKATELKISSSLAKNFLSVFAKVPFQTDAKADFSVFDATEKQQLIFEILSQEIDFAYYTKVGIIESHFPMHNRNTV